MWVRGCASPYDMDRTVEAAARLRDMPAATCLAVDDLVLGVTKLRTASPKQLEKVPDSRNLCRVNI
jgi:hypothetical protein